MNREVRAVARLLDLPEVEPVVAWEGPTRQRDRDAWWRSLDGELVLVRLDLLPGWHVLQAVRDLCAFHAGRHALSLEEAHEQLLPLAHSLCLDSHWEGQLEQILEAARAADFREILFAEVEPAELHVLVAEAARVDLSYVCDLRLATESRATLPAHLRSWIEQEVESSGERLRGQQIADYARNQHTRATLFWRGPQPELAFYPEVLAELEVGPLEEHPQAWCLQPPLVPIESVLAEPDTPPDTARVKELVNDWVSGDELVREVGTGAVLAALEMGLVQIRA